MAGLLFPWRRGVSRWTDDAILDGILFHELGAFARVLLKIALVLELGAHVAWHVAVTSSLTQPTRLAGLLCALSLL